MEMGSVSASLWKFDLPEVYMLHNLCQLNVLNPIERAHEPTMAAVIVPRCFN